MTYNRSETTSLNHFILVNHEKPFSFDPLNADHSYNLTMMRHLYSTPLEMSPENDLTSSLLSQFRYDPETKSIHLEVKEGLLFSNGEGITTKDVAMSIARVAFHKPKFPVVRKIIGLDEWLSSSPKHRILYPDGISVNGNTVSVKFRSHVSNPLYRLCMELFSVVPAKCIDSSLQLTCKKPPFSGLYEIHNFDEEKLDLQKRWKSKTLHNLIIPETIRIQWMSAEETKSAVNTNNKVVALANEYDVPKILNSENKHKIKVTTKPVNRFSAIVFKGSGLFANANARRTFAWEFRKIYASYTETGLVSASITGPYLPGTVDEKAPKNFFDFKGQELTWFLAKEQQNSVFAKSIIQTATKLGFKKYQPILSESTSDSYENFIKNKSDLISVSTGFWPVDLTGDLAMLLTPNLHPVLDSLTHQKELQKLVSAATQAKANEVAKTIEDINNYLIKDSTLAPYHHYFRSYLSNDPTTIKNIPMAVTLTPAWHFFSKVEQ